ncbi:unnamed protein product [Effrenium voratum]|uniref:Aspartokinase n=1 Tax=Effrenium voratum TaxID=2562239 RepID=A0AA36N6F9_9DINO|nr:unnamed protein product [Effrenium voratum]
MPLDFTALCKRTSWETPEPSPICDERRVHPVVMKFGGSALNGPEQVATCVELVRKALGERPIVVVSAMGKATDALLEAGRRALETGAEESVAQLRAFHEAILQKFGVPFALLEPLFGELERLLQGLALVQEMSGRSRDLLVSFGERLSARTFAAAFNASNAEGIEARALDAWEVGMKTTSGSGDADSAYSSVEVLPSAYGEIKQSFAALKLCYDYVPVVTGYIAQDAHGAITTLGRDGSDLTAAVIGAAVKAKEVQLWKDVRGIQSIDPRMEPQARPVEVLTFEEAAELSVFGARVVHPSAVLPAWMAGVPMCIRSFLAPDFPGTRIVRDLELPRPGQVAAISSKQDITMIVVKSSRMLGQHGFLAHVFQLFHKYQASVDVITTSEVTVSMTLDEHYGHVDLDGLVEELRKVAYVTVHPSMALLTLIASKDDSVAVLRRAFDIFDDLSVQVEMVSQGASNVNLTFLLPGHQLERTARQLHAVFFEEGKPQGAVTPGSTAGSFTSRSRSSEE